MKFGHQLQYLRAQEWQNYYVNYSRLKKLIGTLVDDNAGDRPDSMASIEVDARRAQRLVARYTEELKQQVILVGTFFEIQQAEVIASWQRVIGAIESVGQASEDGDKLRCCDWQQCRSQFDTAYAAARKLQHYAKVNCTALYKGMKKFEKKTHCFIAASFLPQLEQQEFFKTEKLQNLLADMDRTRCLVLQISCSDSGGATSKDEDSPSTPVSDDTAMVLLSLSNEPNEGRGSAASHSAAEHRQQWSSPPELTAAVPWHRAECNWSEVSNARDIFGCANTSTVTASIQGRALLQAMAASATASIPPRAALTNATVSWPETAVSPPSLKLPPSHTLLQGPSHNTGSNNGLRSQTDTICSDISVAQNHSSPTGDWSKDALCAKRKRSAGKARIKAINPLQQPNKHHKMASIYV